MNNKPFPRRLRVKLLPVCALLVFFAVTAQAQQTPPIPPQHLPNTGQLLHQVPTQPANEPRSNLDLRMLKRPRQEAPSTRKFTVTVIKITGNTLLPVGQLHALVAGSEDRKLDLEDLYNLAQRISKAYHDAGYPLVRAYVPAQTLHNGVVEIAVVEARYGKVKIDNQSTVSDHTLAATLAPLKTGQPVSNAPLERSLLLLSDVPGANPQSVIRPGAKPGTSDLVVTVLPRPRYMGTVALDDYGGHYTGRTRLSAGLRINSPTHHADRLQLNAMTSGGGMTYLQGGYRLRLNDEGTTLHVGVSSLHYHLGAELSNLDAHGAALVGDVSLRHPFVRRTTWNLYGRIAFERKLLKDDIDVAQMYNDRQANAWVATLAGDQRDANGVTNFRISESRGRIDYTNALAGTIDELTARTGGDYTRYGLSVSRLQQFSTHHAVYLGYTFQGASKNLDTSSQFFLGGPNTVPGYDAGTIAGSQGYLFTAEYRYNFALPQAAGQWLLRVFADSGRVQVYKDRFVPGPNHAQVSSAGLGLHWAGPNHWTVDAMVAKPVGGAPQLLTGANSKTRAWLRIVKGFD